MTQAAPPPIPRQRLALFVFALFATVILYAAGKILLPFITPILMAAIVVTFSFPYYRRLRDRFKGRSAAAAWVMLLGLTILIFIPALILALMLIDEATNLFQLLQRTDMQALAAKLRIADRVLWLKRIVPGFDPRTLQPEVLMISVVRRVPAFVAAHGGQFLAGFANVIVGFLMMLLASYYFYVEGERIVEDLKFLSPLPDEYDREIFEKFRGVVDATFRGQILTALAQGTVTAIGLAIAGVPGSILWGAVAALFSLIPMVGAAVVWVPATLYLFSMAAFGEIGYWRPIFMIIWGVAVVSLVDNLIRPWAMRGGTNMSAIVLFFSILGGIQAFGFVGLILGPLVFALLVTVIHIYKEIFGKTLATQNR